MIVIYGTAFYGKVANHGGQHQLTKFFHVYYVPLIPVGTLWVTEHMDEGYRGHGVRMSGRSVLAGYARVWGPLAVIGGLVAGGVGGLAAVVGAAALCAWSWTWRSLRAPLARRRSDFNLLAFGTRCDPLQMPADLLAVLQGSVDERWALVSEGSTPEDVARLGAKSLSQAVLAYASLRIAARLAPGEHARAARDASERIIAAVTDIDETALEGGPYRAPGLPRLTEGRIADDGAPPA
ncbi:MAG TPA: hypothetical protein VNO30_15225 [Kofleriaceae bacterium]|nr:hypothetical protein [Kofleriaceae bacterium]